jgi:hypothetical protein
MDRNSVANGRDYTANPAGMARELMLLPRPFLRSESRSNPTPSPPPWSGERMDFGAMAGDLATRHCPKPLFCESTVMPLGVGLVVQQFHRMRQYRDDHLQILHRGSGTAGQINDQHPSPDARQPTPEHGMLV